MTTLKGAEVTASRKVVKQEIDRISCDVQADPDAKANDALEMLRKVPMVTERRDYREFGGIGPYDDAGSFAV